MPVEGGKLWGSTASRVSTMEAALLSTQFIRVTQRSLRVAYAMLMIFHIPRWPTTNTVFLVASGATCGGYKPSDGKKLERPGSALECSDGYFTDMVTVRPQTQGVYMGAGNLPVCIIKLTEKICCWEFIDIWLTCS